MLENPDWSRWIKLKFVSYLLFSILTQTLKTRPLPVEAWRILSSVSRALLSHWSFQDVYGSKWQVYVKKKVHTNQTTVHPSGGWGTNPISRLTVSLPNSTLPVLPHLCLLKVFFFPSTFLSLKYEDMFSIRGAQRQSNHDFFIISPIYLSWDFLFWVTFPLCDYHCIFWLSNPSGSTLYGTLICERRLTSETTGMNIIVLR